MINKNYPITRSDVFAVMGLLILILILFYNSTSGYWRADDPMLIWHALQSKGLSAFYNPSDWQKLTTSNLTPWLTFSYKVDLWLAGLSPRFFYSHTMLSLAAVAVSAYVLHRQWVSPAWAFLSVGLFLVGAPTAYVADILMARHYLEGLLFAIVSVIAFVQSVRRQQVRWAIAGALFYALATTAKEIYVPLVLLVLFIPLADGSKTSVKLLAPYFLVAVLYVFWRLYMLEVMIGGYSQTSTMFSWQSVAGMVDTVRRFPEFFFGAVWVLPSLVLLVTAGFAAFKEPASIPAFFALAAGVLLPLFPLIASPGILDPDRYLFLLWFATCFAGVLSIRVVVTHFPSMPKLWQPIGMAAVLVMAVMTFAHTAELQKKRVLAYQEFDAQGRFFFEADQQQGFIPSTMLTYGYLYISYLCEIKVMSSLKCPAALVKGMPTAQPIEQLFQYDPTQNKMVDVSSRLEAERIRIETVDTSRPLQVNVTTKNGFIHWNLGAYDNGQYFFASRFFGRFPVPKQGYQRILFKNLSFYIQYESPEGWMTSSPLFVFDDNKPIIWERSSQK